MRVLVFTVLLGVCAALAMEDTLTDKERSRLSALVFTGTVASTTFVRELESGALWSASVRVESIEGWPPDLATNKVIYFEQFYFGRDERGERGHGRACPLYPEILVGQRMKLWCLRRTFEGYTNVLYVPSWSWARKQPKRRLATGSAGGLPLAPPTPPDMRVRVRRFLIVPKDIAALFLCPVDAGPAQPFGLSAGTRPTRVDTADQVRPFPSGETPRGVPRLVVSRYYGFG